MKQPSWPDTLLKPAGIHINGDDPWDIKVLNPAFYNRVLSRGSLGLGESYMEGWWECRAIDQFFCRLLLADIEKNFTFNLPFAWQAVKASVLNLQSRARSFNIAKKHYDLGNDFFEKMLGQSMAYSCGYWTGQDNLDAAQIAKFDLICRKLHLQPGQKILDIGSGWGGFAKYAATKYGAEVVGVTVSKEQCAFARALCKGLPVEFKLQDYRTLRETFDHIVSIGMFEHVGVKNYATYMKVAARCLKDNGLFLLHTIGGVNSAKTTDPWLGKYIFPGSVIPSLKQISLATENTFVIEDVHNFGADYDTTLMAWHQNFEKNWPAFAGKTMREGKHIFDGKFYRMWKYYLLSCAGMFRSRKIQLWQIVLSPKGVPGGYKPVR